MKEKIFPILKKTFLVVFLIWIGLLLDGIYNNQKSQARFIKSQLLCVKYIAERANYSNPRGKELAEYVGIPNKESDIMQYCRQMQIFSGSGY